MRKLIWLIVILAALYGGYWFAGARLLQSQLDGFVAAQQDAGRTAEFGTLKVQGFPSRFDVSAKDITLYDPQRGIGWSAPEALVAALAYNPQHYIAVLPQQQLVRLPGADISISSADMRASLVFATGPSFVLDRMVFVAKGLGVEAGAPQLRTGASELRLSTNRAEGSEFGHRIGFVADGLILPQVLMDLLQNLPTELPATVDRLHLDAVVDFDKRWDRHALNGPLPQPTKISLSDLSFTWGPIGLTLDADLALDARGVPSGPMNLTIRGLKQMLDIAVAAGILPQQRRGMIEGAISLVARPDAEGVITLAFQAKDSMLYLGPIGLTPLPSLHVYQ